MSVLTQRQEDVLRGIAHGKSYKEIAQQLGISRRTVEGHVQAIKQQLDAINGTHCVYEGYRRGILSG